jgi:flagellar assembly protein FliH
MNAVERFEYPESANAPFVPSWCGWEAAPDASGIQERSAASEKQGTAELNQRIVDETRLSFEAGKARGVEEGRAAERAMNASILTSAKEERIRQTADLVSDFERQTSRYFQTVEQEVVKLALAVAARVLRREAQTDPLLLIGAVRVALGQIAASTEVRLRIPPQDLDLWTEAIALLPNLKTKPQVIAGDGMRVGDCIIETKLGNAELGIAHQLADMERSVLNKQGTDDPLKISEAKSCKVAG